MAILILLFYPRVFRLSVRVRWRQEAEAGVEYALDDCLLFSFVALISKAVGVVGEDILWAIVG